MIRTAKDLVSLLRAAREALAQDVPRDDIAEIRAGLDEAIRVITPIAAYRSEGE